MIKGMSLPEGDGALIQGSIDLRTVILLLLWKSGYLVLQRHRQQQKRLFTMAK